MRADLILYNEDLIILNKFFFILQSNFYKIFVKEIHKSVQHFWIFFIF